MCTFPSRMSYEMHRFLRFREQVTRHVNVYETPLINIKVQDVPALLEWFCLFYATIVKTVTMHSKL